MANDSFEAFNRSQMMNQAQANGDVSTGKNGFLLDLLPRVPGGDAIWGVGSRMWFGVKRACGAILGIFGNENMPNKIEQFLQKFTEDLKKHSEMADQQFIKQAQISAPPITAPRIEAPAMEAPTSGLPRQLTGSGMGRGH